MTEEKMKLLMKLESPVFLDGKFIPEKYTCKGEGINPLLMFYNVPSEAKSLVLIMTDPDALPSVWDHWVRFNISSDTRRIREGGFYGVGGKNSSGGLDYDPPCPPSGIHHYIFKLYALDIILELEEGVSRLKLEDMMQRHILAEAKLIGLFGKN